MIPSRLRDLLAQSRDGMEILEHSEDVPEDVAAFVANLRQKAHNLEQEGEGLVNDALGLRRDADAIEAALLAAAGGIT